MNNKNNGKVSKQTTLFQSWGSRKKECESEGNQSTWSTGNTFKAHAGTDIGAGEAVIDLCDSFDDDADEFLYNAEESTCFDTTSVDGGIGETGTNKVYTDQNVQLDRRSVSLQQGVSKYNDDVGDISIGADCVTPTQGQTQAVRSNLPGFDLCAGKLWIYPTNYPVRDYQYNIVQQALFKNTLVTLPTGLGKTFIGAVLMYNFYRWYPQGKVIFMAPTKPLVAQQIEACYSIMGIPQDHTAEMTGSMGPPKRERAWQEKRVFFLTPQVLTNDLSRGSCPATELKCLVVDEAHKALGNHAYCQVVRELVKYTENFRVLALSATPGSDIKAVQQVLSNLLISHIELRTEESIDISQYTHERKVEKIVIPLGDELTKVRVIYIHIMDVVVARLKNHNVLYNRETTSLSKFLILKAREAFRQNPPEQLQRSLYGVVEGDFALAMSLYHGFELLQLHGLRSLYNFLDGILTGNKGHGRTRSELTRNADFNQLMAMLTEKYGETPSQKSGMASSRAVALGHPKMAKLQEIVVRHFNEFDKKGGTRVMIFSQYRDSVQEITDMLNAHRPLVKVMNFIGQSSAGKAAKGFTQKEQLKVMKLFREGGYNTLVSTCVGEEGLDIGDVDLIICFDAHKSPIRLVQRMGRTGRKREGRIVMLVTQGKEEQIYNQSQYSKRSIHKAILNGARSLHFYQNSPRMLPEGCNPVPHKMFITLKESFKPTRKVDSEGSSRQGKITSFASDKDGVPDVLLTSEEYRELSEWQVPEAEVPQVPTTELVSLQKPHEMNETTDRVATTKVMSLGDWSPWQNTLQPTDQVDHSMASRHLVELMEFIQLQQSLDPGDDPYGLEMAAYLNDEDVLKPGETEDTPGSIRKFCVPCDSTSADPSKPNPGKGKRKLLKKKPRLSDQLPNFQCESSKAGSSDDELPAFNLRTNETNKDTDMETVLTVGQSTDKESVNNASEMNTIPCDFRDKLIKSTHVDVSGIGDVEFVRKSVVKKQFSSLSNAKKCVASSAKSMEKKMAEGKPRKRKRSRQSSRPSAVVEVIADTDANDFDQLQPSFCNIVVKEPSAEMNRNEVVDLTCKVLTNDVEPYSNNSISEPTDIGDKDDRQYVIRTPPTIHDAIVVCETEGEATGLAKLDLEKLVKEWEMENNNGKYIVYPKSSDEKRISKTLKTVNDTMNDNQAFLPEIQVDAISDINILHNVSTSEQTKDACDVKISVVKEVSTSLCDLNVSGLNAPSLTHSAIKRNSDTLNVVDESPKGDKCNGSITLTARELLPSYKIQTSVHSVQATIETNTSCLLNVEELKKLNDSFFDTDIYSISASDGDIMFKTSELSASKQTDRAENVSNDKEAKSIWPVSPDECVQPADKDDKQSLSNKRTNHRALCEFQDVVESSPVPFTTKPSAIVNHNDFDSWLLDDTSDELMLAVNTPAKNNLNYSNTQVTFTQALASVHSCSSVESDEIPFHKQNTQPFHVVEPVNVSKPECGLECVIGVEKVHAGENKTCDNNLKTALGGWKEHSNNSINKYMKDEKPEKLGNKVCYALDNSIDTEVCTESGKSSPELISEYSMHRIQEPSEEQVNKPDIDFDLGFDIDDEIVPPSPNATQKSGISRLSQAFATSINQCKSLAEDAFNDDKHEIAVNECCSRENDSSTHVKRVFGKSLLCRSKRSRKLFNKCDSSARNHSETAGSGQSIVGNILNENSNELKTIKTLLPVVQEQEASYSLINDNDVLEEIAHTDIDKSDPVQFTSQNDQVKCLDKIDYTSKKGIELTKSNNFENSASESMKNYIVTSPKFDSSFALLDEDLDDWINSGNEISNANEKSEDNQMSGNSNSTFTFGSLSRSKKQLKTPVARVRPLTDDNQDMSGKDEPESTENVAGNKKIATLKAARSESFNNSTINAACMITPKLSQGRKSEFLIDDFSPDCFDDSFNMDLESKAATSLCAKRRFSANTSTPVHVPESKIKEITPQRQNEPASPLPKLNTSNVSYKSSPDLGLDNDESFVVRRKKKVCIISSPFTEDVNNECDMSSKYTTDMVNLTIPTKESDIKHSVKDHVKIKKKRIPVTLFSSDEDDFDDSVLLSKKQFGKGKHAAIHDSSDDFNEPETNTKVNTDINSKKLNIQKGTFMDKGHGNKLIDNRYTNAKKKKRNRASNPFLCEEAELSEEDAENVSDDEEEHSDLDVYEDSFIHDSQFAQSQACSQTDMQAVYMKSVKSPNVGRGKYKLQYDYKHVDVFSQVPQNEDSHYMEDSFCVGEEGDDWLGGLAEDEEEITVYQPESTVLHTGRKKRRAVGKYLETGRQREIQAGRMRALDEIKSRLAGNNNKRKQVIAKPVILSSTSSDDEVSEKAPKRSRIRMLLDDSSSEEDTDIHIINKSHIKSTANQLSCNVKTRKAKIFSSSDDDASDFMQKGNRSKVLARSRSGNIDVVNQQSNHADLDKIRVSKVNEIGHETVNAESLKFSQEIRQDRLQRQQLKQEQYRRNMANSNKAVNIPGNASANQSSNSGLRTFDKDHSLTKVKPKMSISQKISNDNNDKALDIMSVTRQSALLETGLLQSDTSRHTPPSGKLVVLVDSKEISGSQDIVSDLRFKHNVQVSVAQVPGCDYILSNRMAVERKQWSEFSNGANRAKLVERMQHLADLYDRSSLIVENDRVKPGEERSTKPKHWTKYVDRTIAMLLRSDIKVLFTDNQSETAALIADLCHLEQRKGMAITVPVDLSAQKQSAIKFYVSIPKLSYVHALNLCSGFVSVSQFMKSSVSVIQKKGQMSESRAFDVHVYLRRTFDSNMLPSALERY